ncbi:MAG: DUF2383 domain-containing protein [Sphingobacteriaceae bacterium]|nr:DUF2383 domain-containing protein [Sphingobacteriaceae bacterium]
METSYQENYKKQLQRLESAVVKSQKKYIKASEQIESEEFRNLFHKYSDQRTTIINELNEAIRHLGGVSENRTEPEPGIHTSPGTKADIKKDQTVLETLRGSEQETLDVYDEVLQGSILEDFNLKTLLMSHRLTINEAYTDLDKRYFDLFKLSQPY